LPVNEPKVMVWFSLATLKTLLVALLKPLALAVNCLFVPAESMRKSVKATIPLPAPMPMFIVVVPSNGPVPELSARVTFWVLAQAEGGIIAELIAVRITGCVASTEPFVPLAGCVVKASCAARAGLTAMAVEVVLVKPLLVN
jgi:hypothetical protein